jgi:hypothetical protein
MNKKWNFDESAEYLHIAHISIMEDQFNVAKVCRKDWGLDAVVEMRNAARLIAAAPDLKAALENALRSMEYAAMALEAPEKCALRENIEQAKEALKKSGLE